MTLYYWNGLSLLIDIFFALLAGSWIWCAISIYQLKKQVDDQKEEISTLKRKFINFKRSAQPLDEDEEMDYEFMKKPFS